MSSVENPGPDLGSWYERGISDLVHVDVQSVHPFFLLVLVYSGFLPTVEMLPDMAAGAASCHFGLLLLASVSPMYKADITVFLLNLPYHSHIVIPEKGNQY